jgi:CMP-N-acetylneuraminic acid synthetase
LKLVFDEIWVSTDDQRIAKIAESYEVKVHFRNEKSATDSASSLIAIQEFLDLFELKIKFSTRSNV